MRRRRFLAAGTVLAAAGVGTVAGLRRLDASWSSHPDPVGPEEWELPAGRSLPVVAADGARLAVTVAGDGPPVVLAHGWTSRSRMWAPVAHRLVTAGRRVVVYDERGHGESTLGEDGPTLEALGDDLAAIIEAADVRDAVIVGHSMGGIAVLSAVKRHPGLLAERGRALVLVATGCSDFGFGILERQSAAVMASPLVNRVLGGPYGHLWVRRSVGRSPVREHLVRTCEDTRACDPEVRARFLAAIFATDLGDVLASVAMPTTVLVGTADHLTPPRMARRLVEGIAGARLVTLEGRGHMLPLEAPGDVVGTILAAGDLASAGGGPPCRRPERTSGPTVPGGHRAAG